ncbi:MAG: hypothetical protein ACF8TS_00385, partial [Maioricimonas sp. JB049]
MRHDWFWSVVALVILTCGCQVETVVPEDSTAAADQVPVAVARTEEADSRPTQIEVADLLKAFDMQMWKARINDDPGAVARSI